MNLEQAVVRAVHEKTQEVPVPDIDVRSIVRLAHRRTRRRTAAAALALTAVVGGAALQVAGLGLQQLDRTPLAESTAWPLEEVIRGQSVPAGRYAAAFMGNDVEPGPWAELDVPTGFRKGAASAIRASGGRRVGLWMIDTVNTDPCFSVDFADPGPSVRDLADALAAQPILGGTDPVPVRLGGFSGLYLQQTMPADLDWHDCVTALGDSRHNAIAPPLPMYYFDLWREPGVTTGYLNLQPGQIHRVWILDVDGHRLVVDAAFGSTATAAEQRELMKLVRSIRFTLPPAY